MLKAERVLASWKQGPGHLTCSGDAHREAWSLKEISENGEREQVFCREISEHVAAQRSREEVRSFEKCKPVARGLGIR